MHMGSGTTPVLHATHAVHAFYALLIVPEGCSTPAVPAVVLLAVLKAMGAPHLLNSAGCTGSKSGRQVRVESGNLHCAQRMHLDAGLKPMARDCSCS